VVKEKKEKAQLAVRRRSFVIQESPRKDIWFIGILMLNHPEEE